MRYTFRPLPVWPHDTTSHRQHGQFKRRVDGSYERRSIPFEETIDLLEREVRMLGGGDVVIGVGLSDYDIRQDGLPRANGRSHLHPGVEISFDSRYGRLTYATDAFTTWQDNLRAIALGLEALRKVDRYGVAKRGQQYAGFALLTAGPGQMELGRQLVEQYGGVREAMRATHPDTGNGRHSTRDFQAVLAVKAGPTG